MIALTTLDSRQLDFSSMSDTMSKTTGLFTNFKDDHLTFFALTYENYEATAECLMDLRKHYPSSRVILRSDGDTNPQLPILAERYKVDFRGDERLFGIENGGAVIERMLMLCLLYTSPSPRD